MITLVILKVTWDAWWTVRAAPDTTFTRAETRFVTTRRFGRASTGRWPGRVTLALWVVALWPTLCCTWRFDGSTPRRSATQVATHGPFVLLGAFQQFPPLRRRNDAGISE